MHAAMIATLLYNANRPAATPELASKDFMLVDRDTFREQATAGLIASLKSIAAAMPPAMKGKKRRRLPIVHR